MRETKITLVGAGSLGSYTALLLASMGFEVMRVFDPDFVEYHNHHNQLFGEEDVGKLKVTALFKLIKYLTGVEIVPVNAFAGKATLFYEVVIVMVDSMSARAEIFDAVKRNPKVRLFIDARSGGHLALVYAVNPLDPDGIKAYEDNFYSDQRAVDVACADQTTLPTVWTVAAVVGKFLHLWQNGWVPVCEEVRINCQSLPGVDSEHLSL